METLVPALEAVNNYPYLSLTSVILGCAALVRLARWRSQSQLPPGPKGFPIVGNLFDLASTHLWEQFGAWGREYGTFSFLHPRLLHIVRTLTWISAHPGDVIYFSVLGQETIILNSSKAAVELLDKRSATYSNRPVVMMCGEISGWNKSLALTQYGPRFREFRKFMGKLMGTRASMERFVPLQERETAKCMARIMADPGSLVHQIRK